MGCPFTYLGAGSFPFWLVTDVEEDFRVSWLVYHIVSGDAFFSGLLSVAAGLALVWLRRTRRGQLSGRVLIIVGWILAIAGLEPGHFLSLPATLGCSVWVFVASLRANKHEAAEAASKTTNGFSRFGIILIALILFTSLGRHQPIDAWNRGEPIHVIGDSLSAGLGAGEGAPWPEQLTATLNVAVVNHAEAGATAKSAIDQAEKLPADAFVIVEIGGNDLLGGRSSADFRQDLDQLLADVCSDGRRVVMFELPLPPFYLRFGEAQRSLAANYGVTLIPRRVLASVLFSEAATLDSIHLSEPGHRRLAAEVAERIER